MLFINFYRLSEIRNPILLRSTSIFMISTSTTSPTFKRRPAGLLLRWRSPSCLTPKSINAPKSTTLRTVPLRFIPITRSSIFTTSLRSNGTGRSSRGSRPGRTSCSRMSSKVGSPSPSPLDKVFYRSMFKHNS